MLKLIDILNEVTPPAPKPPAPKFPLPFKSGGVNLTGEAAWNKWRRWADINRKDKYIDDVLNTIKRSNYQTTQRQLDVLVKWFTGVRESLLEVKKKRDRCLRIADRKYKKPSAYKSGAAERCRAGKIWKDLKENWRDTSWENEKGQKITLLQLLDVIKNYPVKNIPIKDIEKIIIKKNTGGIEPDRLDKANTQHPIIIVVDDNNNFKYVLDGNHRANKAIDSGLKSIPAKLVNIKKLSQEFQDVLTEDLNKSNNQDSIKQLFKNIPELSAIGTIEQYTKYLETIFPNSKVKDIVYHSSPNKFEKFRESMFGTYFSYQPIVGTYGDNIYSVVVNVKNPLIKPKPTDSVKVKEPYNKEFRNYNNPTSFSPEGIGVYKYDASIERSSVTDDGAQIKIRTPEQIHILGSKQDIEGFKKYVSKTITEELIREKIKETLRTWFKRKGAPGKTGGWVDCNSPIRKKGKITGYKTCGRQKGEKRSKYPSCRPTPAQCKQPGKGKKWGKTK